MMLNVGLPGRRERGKIKEMDVVRKDMQRVGVTEEGGKS